MKIIYDVIQILFSSEKTDFKINRDYNIALELSFFFKSLMIN